MEQTNITFPEPIEPGRAGQPVKLDTNAWGIAVQQEGTFYRYWVGVVGQVSAEKRDVDLARTTQDKTLLLDYKLQCLKLMGLVANADSRFNGEEALWYDGQHFLVTPYDIFQKSQKEAFTIIIQKQDLPPECANFSNVQMTFRREGENTVTLSKEKLLAFGQHRGELGNSREVIRLLELASNEFCLANPDMFLCYKNGKVYLPDGKQFGFAREEYPIMPEGTVLLPGSAKSAAFIEGPKGRQNGNIALIVDASKACFHQHEPLLSKYKSMFTADLQLRNFDTNAAQFSSQVRGIFVQTEHLPPAKMFKIIEVVAGQIPSNTRFSYKDREVTVEDYFKERYNIALQHPQLPLVKCRGLRLRSDVFFPPELCKIVANQRVTVQQQTTQLMQQTVKVGG
ncbi:hypothetical protein WR25_13836 isoform B [Diploscapter pachys]|uniref:PAZ domain-containing protein n=1 Tax=Diploscapter pachys TaxID=2018661 RepID=A0A2A2KJX0_9BILA|nr:hypothetical protein WR25_13836 isoform B [Diploscapter pachys]